MAELADNHLFEDMTPESLGTIRRNILGLASQEAEAIRSPNNNTRIYIASSRDVVFTKYSSYVAMLVSTV